MNLRELKAGELMLETSGFMAKEDYYLALHLAKNGLLEEGEYVFSERFLFGFANFEYEGQETAIAESLYRVQKYLYAKNMPKLYEWYVLEFFKRKEDFYNFKPWNIEMDPELVNENEENITHDMIESFREYLHFRYEYKDFMDFLRLYNVIDPSMVDYLEYEYGM